MDLIPEIIILLDSEWVADWVIEEFVFSFIVILQA